MQNMLQELGKTSIKVSDMSSQYWCEKQMELRYRFGEKITKEIKKGKAIHEALEDEVNVPVMLEPRNYSDFMYKSLYTSWLSLSSLMEKKRGREIQIYGSINGYKLVGRIDQLQMEDGKVVLLDDKTTANPKKPSDSQLNSNRVQLMVYRKMLDDICSGSYAESNFVMSYGIDRLVMSNEFLMQLRAIGVPEELHSFSAMTDAFFLKYRSIGSLSNTVKIRYIDQSTRDEIDTYRFEYSDEAAQEIITHILKYWNKERAANPVPESEKWKCNRCAFFGNECKVWWPQKTVL